MFFQNAKQETELNDLIVRLQRARRQRTRKELFQKAVEVVGTDAYDGTICKLIQVGTQHISPHFVYRQIFSLHESYARNAMINWFAYYWSFRRPNLVMKWQVKQLCRELAESELVKPRQLYELAIYEMYPPKELADLAMLRAMEGQRDAVYLLLRLAQEPKLKRRREQILNAALGCENITADELMIIVRDFPQARQAAASIALANFKLDVQDIALLMAYDETRYITEAMTK